MIVVMIDDSSNNSIIIREWLPPGSAEWKRGEKLYVITTGFRQNVILHAYIIMLYVAAYIIMLNCRLYCMFILLCYIAAYIIMLCAYVMKTIIAKIHPVSVRRFPSFRTQPLESLSRYQWKRHIWATQPLAKVF